MMSAHGLCAVVTSLSAADIMQNTALAVKDQEMNDVLTSARLEVLVVIWRIREVLQAMPQPPTDITLRRWNHGIARELVRLVYSSLIIGLLHIGAI